MSQRIPLRVDDGNENLSFGIENVRIIEGISPSVDVERISNGVVVTVEDYHGTKTATVYDGSKGETGERGERGERGEKGEKGDAGPMGPIGMQGPPGNPPTITIWKTGTTTEINFSTEYGSETAHIEDGATGARGQNGQNGADGFSPVVSVASISGGHRITITDSTGPHSVDVMDGAKGDKGETGPQGNDYILTANDKTEIADIVKAERVITVSGSTPSIVGVDGCRYVCGVVSTISITPPALGACEVQFTSGTTAAVMTAAGVRWPEWFNPASLETGRVYDVIITDGTFGAVMSWPT